jgi:hypothetical protein
MKKIISLLFLLTMACGAPPAGQESTVSTQQTDSIPTLFWQDFTFSTNGTVATFPVQYQNQSGFHNADAGDWICEFWGIDGGAFPNSQTSGSQLVQLGFDGSGNYTMSGDTFAYHGLKTTVGCTIRSAFYWPSPWYWSGTWYATATPGGNVGQGTWSGANDFCALRGFAGPTRNSADVSSVGQNGGTLTTGDWSGNSFNRTSYAGCVSFAQGVSVSGPYTVNASTHSVQMPDTSNALCAITGIAGGLGNGGSARVYVDGNFNQILSNSSGDGVTWPTATASCLAYQSPF